jgi:cation:H+ antiporter
VFRDLSTWANGAVFVVSALVVWLAGTRVARYADEIETRTGAGEAVVGMLLLGFITALPELGVTVSASYGGNPPLALNNLLGGMALNVAILAAADAAIRGEALTASGASATPLLQAALLMLLLSIVAAASVTGDRLLLGAGLWSWIILALYIACLFMVRNTRVGEKWVAQDAAGRGKSTPRRGRGEAACGSLGPVPAKTALGAAAILAAGYALAQTGDALAEQTGLGASFFGAVFLAVSTSLPEITIVFSAVRLRRYAMAISNIFGANLFGLALIFLADAVYDGGPVLAYAGRFSTFAALLGIAVTAIFTAGLLVRGHRMILRLGLDSLAVILVYFSGVAVLYALR